MPYRSVRRPLCACALLACFGASSACVASRASEMSGPAIPTVVSIPVAPLATGGSRPPSIAVASSPLPPPHSSDPPPSAAGIDGADPSTPLPVAEPESVPPLPPPRVVLVDEPPYRWSPTRAEADASSHPRPESRRHSRSGRLYHPAPGIVVDVTEAQGGATASDLQRAARSGGYWPFRRCYEDGLRRDQRLSGRVSLELTVSSGGAVDRASVESATLRDESVSLCVGREALRVSFLPRDAPTTAKVEVTLSTGDEPVTVPRPVPHAEELREALRASWPAVEQCYAAELTKRPDAGGRLELRFRARSTGEIVEVAEEGESRFADVDVTRCVLGVYRTAKLPAGRVCSSRQTTFAYAMHLEARRSLRSPHPGEADAEFQKAWPAAK
jgi:hypothetical protein